MTIFVLIIWLTGPLTGEIGLSGGIAKVGPVTVASYTGPTAEADCTALLNRMIRTSEGKVEGKCSNWS